MHLDSKEDAKNEHRKDELHTLKFLVESCGENNKNEFLDSHDELPVEVGLAYMVGSNSYKSCLA